MWVSTPSHPPETAFRTFREYGVQATLTIIILDGSGKNVFDVAGFPGKDRIKSELEKLL